MDDDTPTRRAMSPQTGASREPAAGQRLFGRYLLECVAGRGGMGVVWRARDEELGDTVALKFLPEIVAVDAVAVDELREETRRARRLTHPHIVRIYNFERDGTMAAVTMEYVAGSTLAQRRLEQPGKVFAPQTLAPIVAQLCAALDYAHVEAKVVHRDLKPANLLLTDDGQLKIADFGIARSLSETHTRLTGRTSGNSGTLLYMSPQQLIGERPTAADDHYAVGATLYELLCGKPPFFSGDVTHQILHKAPAGLSQMRRELDPTAATLPPAWERTILRCLDKDAAKRPQGGAEIARLLGVDSGTPSPQPPAGAMAKPASRSSLRYPTGGQKWEDLEPRVPSSIHYPNPDRNKSARPRTWFDLLIIVGLVAAGAVYFLGLTPLPRPWLDQPAAIDDAGRPPGTGAPAPTTGAGAIALQPAGAPTPGNPGTALRAPAPAKQENSIVSAGATVPARVTPQEAAPPARPLRPAETPARSPVPVKAAVPAAVNGSVRLTVEPTTARAWLDDDPAARTSPLDWTDVPAGHHVLKLQAPGHIERRLEFDLTPGQELNLGMVRLASGLGGLVVDSQPSFIQFELKDDAGKVSRGVTPWDDNKLPAGAYTLTFVRPGNENSVRRIQIEAHGVLRITADFSGGNVNISQRGGVAMPSASRSSAIPEPATAPPAPVVPAAVAPAPTFATAAPIVAATTPQPRPATGRLQLEVTGPSDYLLYVNDRLTFRTAGDRDGVELPAGEELKVELRATGFSSVIRRVTPPAGGSITLKVAMEPLPAERPVEAASSAAANPAAPIRPEFGPAASAGPAEQSAKSPGSRGETVRPRLIASVTPVYPATLRSQGIQGTVTVRLKILTNGRVGEVEEVSSPSPLLTQAVREALRQFRFTPARVDGRAVEIEVTMDFEFRM